MKPLEAFAPTYREAGSVRNQCKACRYAKWKACRDAKTALLPPKPKPPGDVSRLAGHIPEPAVMNAVLDYARQLGSSFTVGDIWRPLQLPRTAVNRVLSQLLKQGRVTRWQVPMPCQSGLAKPGTTTLQYLYELVEPSA